MALLRRLYEKLHLSVNESKSAVASAFGRKFLGHAFWASPQGVKRAVAVKARKQFKQRIRELTRRSGGRSMRQVVENRGTTIYHELRALEASSQSARKVAANSCSWWRNSRFELNRVLDIAWFDRLGLVRLS